MGALKRLISSYAHLLSPRTCRICGCTLTSKEDVLCLGCLLEMPRTNVHHHDFNEIHRRLGHHSVVDRAAGWFYYKKGTDYAQMLIDAKYNSLPKIDYCLGKICAKELIDDNFFEGIDTLVPMPMHWFKRFRRGYNQAEEICRGVSEITGIGYTDALKAVKSHGVQARHNKSQRHQSIANTIDVADSGAIKGRHVLLVDDIITSGASAIEAIRALSSANPASISILTLGLTIND